MVYSKIVHKIRALEICFGYKSNEKMKVFVIYSEIKLLKIQLMKLLEIIQI